METRTLETAARDAARAPLYIGIHWSAIFAGLAVGLGVHLLLMLVGAAAGLAVFGSGSRPGGDSVLIAAALWNTLSMVVSAFVGGYVAARGAGLRRHSDGMLHGVVAWGATTLFVAVVTGSLGSTALSGTLGLAAATSSAAVGQTDRSAMSELIASLERGDRPAAVRLLRDRMGLSNEQAERAVEQVFAMRERAGAATEAASVNDAAQAASLAGTWLSLAVLLSLIASAVGGSLGTRGVRAHARRRDVHLEQRVSPTIGAGRRAPGAG
ncbi:MAG: hypothetical protein LPJ94_10040 [Thauera sp.]|nr:hypothetical protein [Thauera sp.]